jgi:hypothetical protein
VLSFRFGKEKKEKEVKEPNPGYSSGEIAKSRNRECREIASVAKSRVSRNRECREIASVAKSRVSRRSRAAQASEVATRLVSGEPILHGRAMDQRGAEFKSRGANP